MPHPVHAILKRFFDIEQFAFDATPREFWPSERYAPGSPRAYGNTKGRAEPVRNDGLYLEREPES